MLHERVSWKPKAAFDKQSILDEQIKGLDFMLWKCRLKRENKSEMEGNVVCENVIKCQFVEQEDE